MGFFFCDVTVDRFFIYVPFEIVFLVALSYIILRYFSLGKESP